MVILFAHFSQNRSSDPVGVVERVGVTWPTHQWISCFCCEVLKRKIMSSYTIVPRYESFVFCNMSEKGVLRSIQVRIFLFIITGVIR